jgi:hypothetical protein
LTDKSITTILHEEEAAGRLVRFVPEMDHDETDVRELYLAANVHEFVRGNTEKHKNKAYFQRIRAALGEYVKGETINDDDETLKSLKHLYGDRTLAYEWEFKITFHPAARIFGFLRSGIASSFLFLNCALICRQRILGGQWKKIEIGG